ncbi:unnamed protein product [Urochloa decumbens]|uniref:Glycosyltransferase N-terminal domain-containing protein n=1 Tax=Urochloa decumbens TaxID=240449 RepID=A0ABC9D8M8_9POAL
MEMESVAVVAVPFPAQGHLNQLLHLSLQLAAHGLPVHYAAPAEHILQARARARLRQQRPPPRRVPRAPHLRVHLAPARPRRGLTVPVPPHAPLGGLHRQRARRHGGAPPRGLRLLPTRRRHLRPPERLRRRGGRAGSQRRALRRALHLRVGHPWADGRWWERPPAPARARVPPHRQLHDGGVLGIRHQARV